MEAKEQTTEQINDSIAKDNDDTEKFMIKYKSQLENIIIEDNKVTGEEYDQVKIKMDTNESRQQLKMGKNNVIDIVRLGEEFLNATTATMLYDVIKLHIKKPKKNKFRKSAKNFNCILNWIDLDEDQQEILRIKLNDEDYQKTEELPSFMSKDAIKCYIDYLETDKWNYNYNFLILRLSDLENGRDIPSESIDIISSINAIIKGSASEKQKAFVEQLYPYELVKANDEGKITLKYKQFLRQSKLLAQKNIKRVNR